MPRGAAKGAGRMLAEVRARPGGAGRVWAGRGPARGCLVAEHDMVIMTAVRARPGGVGCKN